MSEYSDLKGIEGGKIVSPFKFLCIFCFLTRVSLAYAHSLSVTTLYWSGSRWIWSQSQEHKLGVNPGWGTSSSQGTVHKHFHTFTSRNNLS